MDDVAAAGNVVDSAVPLAAVANVSPVSAAIAMVSMINGASSDQGLRLPAADQDYHRGDTNLTHPP